MREAFATTYLLLDFLKCKHLLTVLDSADYALISFQYLVYNALFNSIKFSIVSFWKQLQLIFHGEKKLNDYTKFILKYLIFLFLWFKNIPRNIYSREKEILSWHLHFKIEVPILALPF